MIQDVWAKYKLKKLKKELIGKVFNLKNFDEPMMIHDVKLKFECGILVPLVKLRYSNKYETVEVWYRYGEVKRDHVRNILKINKYGTYLGLYGTRDEFDTYIYNLWKHIHERCNTHVVYEHASVCEEWLSFANFYKWTKSPESNYSSKDNQQIDKDILQWGCKDKIYSPSTCVFIPTYLNKYLSGLSKRNGQMRDRITMIKLNKMSIFITAKQVNHKKYLFDYCRYYVFNALIKYYLDNNKIPQLIFDKLSIINRDINKISSIDKCEQELPKEVKDRMDLFINTELNNLKIRENEVCSETRVL